MIDAIRGARPTRSVPDVGLNTLRNTRQTTSDAFHGLFANVTAGLSRAQTAPGTVSLRNDSSHRLVQHGTRGHLRPAAMRGRGTDLLNIDVTQPAAQPAVTRTKDLVAIPMLEPVQPAGARDAVSAAAGDPSAPQPDPGTGDPIARLTQAMQDFGIDTSKLSITTEDYSNSNPGGVWVDHELKVSTQDGKSVHLAVDLLQKNYAVGACDVQRMLNYSAPA